MTGRRLRNGSITLLAALAFGCGGGRGQFSTAAVPVAVKLRESLAKSNTSEIGGVTDSARTLHRAGAITDGDLKLFVLIYNLAQGNSYEDAKKVLEEALAGRN